MKQHAIFISIILFFTLMGVVAGSQAETFARVGSSIEKHKSLPNAMVAAHFQCNRQRLWANLDTLRVIDEYKETYTISGGRKKITVYKTMVEFECTPTYKKEPDNGQSD
jgi:hypothetical protein